MPFATTADTSASNRATDKRLIPMSRIIIIDGCSANIIFQAGAAGLPQQTTAVAGGRLAGAAILLGEAGREVFMMGEAGRDPLGNLLVERLEQGGVDTSCIDRYSDGASTPSVLIFPSGNPEKPTQSIVYRSELAERWDSRWPRVDRGDIVVFGGYFSLQQRVRSGLVDFIDNARQRGALIVNLPGFNPAMAPAVTRIMPALLENLEMADAVMTATDDLNHLFPGMTPEECYRSKISFYTPLMVNIDPLSHSAQVFTNGFRTSRTLAETAGVNGISAWSMPVALFIDALNRNGITPASIGSLPTVVTENIADSVGTSSRQAINK